MSGTFPPRSISDENVEASRRFDKQQKAEKEEQVNTSKYKKKADLLVGDHVLVRNYRRRSKFQPLFNPEQYIVSGISDYGRKLEIERLADGQTLLRHPDDLKRFYLPSQPASEKIPTTSPWEILNQQSDQEWYSGTPEHIETPALPHNEEQQPEAPQLVPAQQPQQRARRQSGRDRNPPNRMGAVVYDEAEPLPGENDDNVIPNWWPGYPREQD